MPIEKIGQLNLEAIKSARMQFERIAGTLLAAEKLLESQKASEMWVFRLTSLEQALERARAFHNELQRSFDATMAGKPLGADAKKVGRPMKKATKPKPKKGTP